MVETPLLKHKRNPFMIIEYITIKSHVAVASPSDRRKGESIINRYEKLYRQNKDFRDYVDRYMRNKEGVKLKDVLRNKQIQLVGDMYESEGK